MNFINQRNEPHHEEECMSKLVTQPSFRAVGQTHAEWIGRHLKNKRQMNGSQAWVEWLHAFVLIFGFFKWLPFHVFGLQLWCCSPSCAWSPSISGSVPAHLTARPFFASFVHKQQQDLPFYYHRRYTNLYCKQSQKNWEKKDQETTEWVKTKGESLCIAMFHVYKHCNCNANVPTLIWKDRFV